MRLLLIFVSICYSQVILAQNAPIVHDVVDIKASFPGGDSLLQVYTLNHLSQPDSHIENKSSGTVVIKFLVDDKGQCSDFRVLKKIVNCEQCTQNALNFARSMPDWLPGQIDHKPVYSYGVLRLKFN